MKTSRRGFLTGAATTAAVAPALTFVDVQISHGAKPEEQIWRYKRYIEWQFSATNPSPRELYRSLCDRVAQVVEGHSRGTPYGSLTILVPDENYTTMQRLYYGNDYGNAEPVPLMSFFVGSNPWTAYCGEVVSFCPSIGIGDGHFVPT